MSHDALAREPSAPCGVPEPKPPAAAAAARVPAVGAERSSMPPRPREAAVQGTDALGPRTSEGTDVLGPRTSVPREAAVSATAAEDFSEIEEVGVPQVCTT